jgi:hypothetical protein
MSIDNQIDAEISARLAKIDQMRARASDIDPAHLPDDVRVIFVAFCELISVCATILESWQVDRRNR